MKFYAKFGIVALLAGMVALGGCGSNDNDSPTVQSKSTTVAADQVTVASGNATVAAGKTVVAQTSSGVQALSIPAGVTIDTNVAMTAPPTITVSTPSNGTTSGVTAPKISGVTYTVTDSAGAVDISINGASSFTLNNSGATVVIPVVKTPAAVGANATPVRFIKSDGTTGMLTGTYAATTGTTGPGTVTVTGVTNFCWFAVEAVLTSPTGSTGGTGGTGT